MMKHNVITWMAASCIALAAHAQRPLRWVADAAQTAPVTFDCSRGETLTFAPVLKAYGTTLTNYTASFQWQTNGMGGLFWSTNVLAFTPSMDVGASRYRFWIRAETTNGVMYSAQGTINMLHAPGAIVNALPLPVQQLNFSTVSWTNAPWLLPDSAYSTTVSRASSAYGWGNHASAGYLTTSGGELNENATWIFRDLYLYTTYSVSGIELSSPPFGISATLNYPQDLQGSFTLATREWARDYVSTGSPPSGLSGAQVTNIVESAREFHVDSYTNVIWRSVYSNGWTWLVAYTNYPAN